MFICWYGELMGEEMEKHVMKHLALTGNDNDELYDKIANRRGIHGKQLKDQLDEMLLRS